MQARTATISLLCFLTACEPQNTHVVGPFYLTYFETRDEMALFAAPAGQIRGVPSTVFQMPRCTRQAETIHTWSWHEHPRPNGSTKRDVSEFFYFALIKDERLGWGEKPEHIVGPLTGKQFDVAKRELDLPTLSIVFDDLK